MSRVRTLLDFAYYARAHEAVVTGGGGRQDAWNLHTTSFHRAPTNHYIPYTISSYTHAPRVPHPKGRVRKDGHMGFRSWLRERFSRSAQRKHRAKAPGATRAHESRAEIAPGFPLDEWEEVPAYLPVDPAEHLPACIIASAIAAGAQEESKLVVKRVSVANPEHQRVAVIATALGAGALEKSSFAVKRIYKQKDMEGTQSDAA